MANFNMITFTLLQILNLYVVLSQTTETPPNLNGFVDVKAGMEAGKCTMAWPMNTNIKIATCFEDPMSKCHHTFTCSCTNGKKGMVLHAFDKADTACTADEHIHEVELLTNGECTPLTFTDVDCGHGKQTLTVYEAIDESEWDENCDASLCDDD
mmetsp:Transcript_50943/g.45737  ORF Transcript_50943/g.45737 Transcript_50943/m.45737 type:complete len:154 (+) Transcript_50943:106-567(+)